MTRRWIHRSSGRVGLVAALTVMLVMAFGSTGFAQPSTCELVAPWELTEATGAAFGEGEMNGTSCTWRTETRDGHVLTITLDVSRQPPSVTIETDDPSLDAATISQAIAALATERMATGDAAPAEPPTAATAGERPDLCALFPADGIAAMLGVAVMPYGSMGEGACGYIGDEPGRSLDVLVAFQDGSYADILRDWPEALDVRVVGLPGLDYGWEVGTTRTSYVSVEIDGGLLTAKVKYDDTDHDAAAVARALVERVLAEMGHAGG